jgi:hypothetical protein
MGVHIVWAQHILDLCKDQSDGQALQMVKVSVHVDLAVKDTLNFKTFVKRSKAR